jgi:2-C-methyl-D-erythritol 4-phosphate cytidylyltransferase
MEPIDGVPVIALTLKNVRGLCPDSSVIIAAPENDIALYKSAAEKHCPGFSPVFVCGGATRAGSVLNAVKAMPAAAEIIAVHDAARPLAGPGLFERCFGGVERLGCGVVAARRVTDTIKTADKDCFAESTPDRAFLWAAETPQVFPADILRRAWERAAEKGLEFTDDAAAVAAAGGKAFLLEHGGFNIKITRPDDIHLAEFYYVRNSGNR